MHVFTLGSSSKGAITGISNYHNFEFTAAEIRGWYAYNIGEGGLIPYVPRAPSLPTLEPIHLQYTEGSEHHNLLRGHTHWRQIKYTKVQPSDQTAQADSFEQWAADSTLDWTEQQPQQPQSSASVEGTDDPDVLEGVGRQLLYPCQVEGCTKIYQTYGNWIRHITLGEHTMRIERQVLRDFAIDEYARQIESSQLFSSFANVAETQRNEDDRATVDAANALRVGWALKQKRKVKRFSQKQKDYLTTKFNEGAETNRKYNPQDVAKNMRRDPQFPSRDDWLTATQIASFWSRLSAQRDQSAARTALAAAASQQAAADEHELEELPDDQYANAYEGHIDEAITSVLTNVLDNAPQ